MNNTNVQVQVEVQLRDKKLTIEMGMYEINSFYRQWASATNTTYNNHNDHEFTYKFFGLLTINIGIRMQIMQSRGFVYFVDDQEQPTKDFVDWLIENVTSITCKNNNTKQNNSSNPSTLTACLTAPTADMTAHYKRWLGAIYPLSNGQIQTQGGSGKVYVLGRLRNITKVGRKSMITYLGSKISLTEARALEKQLKHKHKK